MTKVARDVMQGDALTVPADMEYLRLVHLFVVAEIGGAPVVDAGGRVIGVVTLHDLLRAVDQAFDDEVDADEPRGPRELGRALRSLTAGDLASQEVLWVDEETPLARVAGQMRRSGAHRVLVGKDGRLAGVLTTFDLLAALEGAAP